MKSNRPATFIMYSFAIVKFFIPFIFINSSFQLQRDEYLYMADAQHLAWGYIEMPPLLAFLGSISHAFGSSEMMVRIWGALIGAFTLLVTAKIAIRLNGGTYAVFLTCLAFLCSAFLRLHILFQPNILDAFFWTLACYYVVCWLQTDEKKYLYYIGICFGLGILSKYTIAFFIIAFFIAVLLTHKRKWLANKHFYFAMLLALVIALPNLYWQYQHHFPIIHHMKLLRSQQLEGNSRVTFLMDQLLMFLGVFYLVILALWFTFFTNTGRKYIAIGIMYTAIIVLLFWTKGKGYYTVGIYPIMLAVGSVYFASITKGKFSKLFRIVLPVVSVLFTIIIFPVALPFMSPDQLSTFYKKNSIDKTGLLTWEDHQVHALPQDFGDMLGWKEMADKTLEAYDRLPDTMKKNTIVFGDNYGQASAVEFYKGKRKTPVVYSDNASFVFWLPNTFSKNTNVLLISHRQRPHDDYVFKHFKQVTLLDSVTDKYAREYGAKIFLYAQPDDSFHIVAQKAIAELKAEFNAQ